VRPIRAPIRKQPVRRPCWCVGPGPGTSSLHGSFQVDAAVVASGHVHLADLQKVSFTLTATFHPDFTFTSIGVILGNDGVIDVNAQGLPTSPTFLQFPLVVDPYDTAGECI